MYYKITNNKIEIFKNCTRLIIKSYFFTSSALHFSAIKKFNINSVFLNLPYQKVKEMKFYECYKKKKGHI